MYLFRWYKRFKAVKDIENLVLVESGKERSRDCNWRCFLKVQMEKWSNGMLTGNFHQGQGRWREKNPSGAAQSWLLRICASPPLVSWLLNTRDPAQLVEDSSLKGGVSGQTPPSPSRSGSPWHLAQGVDACLFPFWLSCFLPQFYANEVKYNWGHSCWIALLTYWDHGKW